MVLNFRSPLSSTTLNSNDSDEPSDVACETNSQQAVQLANKLQILVLVDPRAAKFVEGVVDGLLEGLVECYKSLPVVLAASYTFWS